jgi:energy-coupling factor transporter ATP-binding protein EcfA2
MLSSFRGHRNAHALLEGNAMNGVAIAAFDGEGQAEVPLNKILVGPKGSGKSVFLNWLLYVLSHFFQYRIILDYSGKGTAFRRYLKTFGLGLEPVVLKGARHQSSLNPIDTNKNPFTEMEFQAPLVTSVCLLMGVNNDIVARATVDDAVSHLVRTHLQTWMTKKQGRGSQVTAMALAISTCAERDKLEFLDAFHNFEKLSSEERSALMNAATKEQLHEFTCSYQGKDLTWRLAASFIEHSEWCTLSDLVQVLHFDANAPLLAKSLSAYCRSKSYGKFFDAPTNVDLSAPCVYFDLSAIAADEVHLQSAFVSIIFTNVLGAMLKQNGRKALVIDEALALFSFKGSEELIARAYRTFRKNRCACWMVVHDVKTLEESPASEAIISNTDLWYIFRQIGGSNLERLQKLVGLPLSALIAIKDFKAPSIQTDKQNLYADVYIHSASDSSTQGGTARLYAPPITLEMTEPSP